MAWNTTSCFLRRRVAPPNKTVTVLWQKNTAVPSSPKCASIGGLLVFLNPFTSEKSSHTNSKYFLPQNAGAVLKEHLVYPRVYAKFSLQGCFRRKPNTRYFTSRPHDESIACSQPSHQAQGCPINGLAMRRGKPRSQPPSEFVHFDVPSLYNAIFGWSIPRILTFPLRKTPS